MKVFHSFLIFLFVFLLGACSRNEHLISVDYIKIEDINNNSRVFHGVIKALNSAILSFQSEGKIVFLPYTKGDFIKKGEVIARLDGALYLIKKNEETAKLQEYIVQQNKQKRYYDRLNILHKEGAISDNDWESAFYELKTLSAQIEMQKEKINYINKEISYNIISAPFDGYISDKFLDVGSYAKIASPVVSFISSQGFQVEIMLGEDDINKLTIGENVRINILDNNYIGNVSHISKSSINTGGYLVKINLNNSSSDLKEGMSADVEFNFDIQKNLYIPIKCVFEEDDKKFVYEIVNVKNNIGEIKKKNISTGRIVDDKIEILDGVFENDLIVLNYFGDLKNKKVRL